ncbi:MAG: asparagine synthase (glutamine-hydrolyzing), partial [Gemmatimonadales bacterium]
MILGIFDRKRPGRELERDALRAASMLGGQRRTRVWADENVALCFLSNRNGHTAENEQPLLNEDKTISMVFEGRVHNAQEVKRYLGRGHADRTTCSGEVVLHLYEDNQDDFLNPVNGKFAFALWDKNKRQLLLGRDRLGIESLYYFDDGERLVFSSSLTALLSSGWVEKCLNPQAVLQYLLFCYNPGDETLVRDVFRLPAAHILSCNGAGVSLERYWRLSFAETVVRSEDQTREELLNLIRDSIHIRLDSDDAPGVFLSGGTDSSAIVSLTSGMVADTFPTFSFRCEQGSYDESRYARFVARHYGTQHTEIPYRSEHLRLIAEAVEWMDEPFCDVGIEIGTYLLGQGAEGGVSYVLSGEGGDELFGGHPVYIADKFATLADRVPEPILKPLTWALRRIPDSDQKKNLQVKLKRFAYGLSFRSELLSHRWRIYYTRHEVEEACGKEFLAHCDLDRMFDAVLRYSEEADGGDKLSRSLYSDFHTVVSFYLRRVGLLRAFGLESRLPLLDYRLVEYSARTPSRMKVRGFS